MNALSTWLTWTLVVLAVGVVAFFLRRFIRRVEAAMRKAEDRWALTQLARILAQRDGRPQEVILQGLEAGEPRALPTDFRSAALHYEQASFADGKQHIRKTLCVSFTDNQQRAQEVEVQTDMDWLDLPDEVRDEMIRTGKTVVREFTLPQTSVATKGGDNVG